MGEKYRTVVRPIPGSAFGATRVKFVRVLRHVRSKVKATARKAKPAK